MTTAVSSAALSTLSDAKLNQPQTLPLTEDVTKLNTHEYSSGLQQQLEVSKNTENYSELFSQSLYCFTLARWQ